MPGAERATALGSARSRPSGRGRLETGSGAALLLTAGRVALELAGIVVATLFVLRVVGDTVTSLGWLRWATPLGWAEQIRPLTGAQPAVLLLPAAVTALLLALAARLMAARDIATGLLPDRDSAEPRTRRLGSPTGQALRSMQGVLLAWAISLATFAFMFGTVAKSVSPADVSDSIQRKIAKLGSGAITTPTGYLAFVFIFLVLAICTFVCIQVGAARQAETGGRLETLLALPLARRRWLLSRLALTLGAAAMLATLAGLLAWAGASTGGAHMSLPPMLEAGANALPIANALRVALVATENGTVRPDGCSLSRACCSDVPVVADEKTVGAHRSSWASPMRSPSGPRM